MCIMYVPDRGSLTLARQLKPEAIVYDHVMDWRAVPKKWAPPYRHRMVDDVLLEMASRGRVRLMTDSPAVLQAWRELGFVNAHQCLPAADDEFLSADWTGSTADVVGYFGYLRYDEIDVEYLVDLSRNCTVEVKGPVDEAARVALMDSSVRVLPPGNLSDVVDTVRRWKAVLLPYRRTLRTPTLMPAKLLNALATGRPIYVANLDLPAELSARVLPLPRASDFLDRLQADMKRPDRLRSVATWNDRWSDIGAWLSESTVESAGGS
jgi:hypothetical protein